MDNLHYNAAILHGGNWSRLLKLDLKSCYFTLPESKTTQEIAPNTPTALFRKQKVCRFIGKN